MIDFPKELARIRSRKLTSYDENRVKPTESELMRDIEILESYILELGKQVTVNMVERAELIHLRSFKQRIYSLVKPMMDF